MTLARGCLGAARAGAFGAGGRWDSEAKLEAVEWQAYARHVLDRFNSAQAARLLVPKESKQQTLSGRQVATRCCRCLESR